MVFRPNYLIQPSGGGELKRTPLYEAHLALGARMVEFAGWLMPVQYTGILEEHRAVRERAGLFDISHMGEMELRGKGALRFLQRALTNDASRLATGQAQYTLLCNHKGGVIDDLLVYRRGEERYLLVVNAANTGKDYQWLSGLEPDAELVDLSMDTALLALQGPSSQDILCRLTSIDLASLSYYCSIEGQVGGVEALISRTGYTGEDGFELFVPWETAPDLWRRILEVGKEDGLIPVGLGARDTLRLEAAMPLHGHELDETITPLEAGLTRFVDFNKADFVGKEALLQQREGTLERGLIGLAMEEAGIPRHGYPILSKGKEVGGVTSGTYSPTLNRPIAMGYVQHSYIEEGTELEVLIHGRPRRARVVRLPFYERKRRVG